jgi:hypothetical protein
LELAFFSAVRAPAVISQQKLLLLLAKVVVVVVQDGRRRPANERRLGQRSINMIHHQRGPRWATGLSRLLRLQEAFVAGRRLNDSSARSMGGQQWASHKKKREESPLYFNPTTIERRLGKSSAEPLEQQQQQERGKSGSKWFTCGLISS